MPSSQEQIAVQRIVHATSHGINITMKECTDPKCQAATRMAEDKGMTL